MSKIKLSIIIPVYNVEKYINQCVDSILAQNIMQTEIILIDDGSTDNSGKICDEYSEKNENIRTFHQKNMGVSCARNYGIKQASGEYLMFIDSDDYINKEINLKEIIDYLKYDIIQFNVSYYYPKQDKMIYLKELNITNEEDIMVELKKKIKYGELSIASWDKIIKRTLIIENSIYFEENLSAEDIDWSLKLYLKAKNIFTINLPIYVYRQNRVGSITYTGGKKSIDSLFYIVNKWKNYDYDNEEIKKIFLNYIAYQYVILLVDINKKNCTREQKKEIYKMKDILEYNDNYKVRMCKKLIDILGLRISIFILKFYVYLKDHAIIKI